VADDFNTKAAPAPVAEPTRDRSKFRRFVVYGDFDSGKKLDHLELNIIDYDSNDPKEETVVGKSATLELRDSAKSEMGAELASALKAFISKWMTSRKNEPAE